MNTHDAPFVRPVLAALCGASLAALVSCGGSACFGLDGCSGGNGMPKVALSGTAATGKALASAMVSFSCAAGSGSTLSDGGGQYSITLDAALPCILTVTSGGTTLHSLAFAGGTFNTTPETELMFVYLASQLGTNEASLIAGFPSNSQFQRVLANQTDVLAAQSAVVTNLQQPLCGHTDGTGVSDDAVYHRASRGRQRSRRAGDSRCHRRQWHARCGYRLAVVRGGSRPSTHNDVHTFIRHWRHRERRRRHDVN